MATDESAPPGTAPAPRSAARRAGRREADRQPEPGPESGDPHAARGRPRRRGEHHASDDRHEPPVIDDEAEQRADDEQLQRCATRRTGDRPGQRDLREASCADASTRESAHQRELLEGPGGSCPRRLVGAVRRELDLASRGGGQQHRIVGHQHDGEPAVSTRAQGSTEHAGRCLVERCGGSSSRSTSGFMRSARATATRAASPPESSADARSANGAPTRPPRAHPPPPSA